MVRRSLRLKFSSQSLDLSCGLSSNEFHTTDRYDKQALVAYGLCRECTEGHSTLDQVLVSDVDDEINAICDVVDEGSPDRSKRSKVVASRPSLP